MRRWLGRSRMDQMEVNIMRGFLAAVERKIDKDLPE
jgi:tRNA C32,U32 (ribose-2'-O)-methylase TrmJ